MQNGELKTLGGLTEKEQVDIKEKGKRIASVFEEKVLDLKSEMDFLIANIMHLDKETLDKVVSICSYLNIFVTLTRSPFQTENQISNIQSAFQQTYKLNTETLNKMHACFSDPTNKANQKLLKKHIEKVSFINKGGYNGR